MEAVHKQAALDRVSLPYSHATSTRRSLYVGCTFRAWCSLESGHGNNLQPTSFAAFFSLSLSLLLRIKGLHKAQAGNFTESLWEKKARLRRESSEEGANLLTDLTGDLDLFVQIPAVKDQLE